MAGFSIDHNNLPGVKEVCRDFAVLEDHCLAHNLQEQEIESHLASNVHKSRLAQQDLQVAKRLQEEEDLRAKAESHKHLRRIERIDNEMAQEIQDQLVRQAEQQRQQEEKDEAIARKLQEREMKEERKRQKHSEANFEDEYHEDKASKLPLDLHEQNSSYTSRKVKHQNYNSSLSPRNSPDPCKERPSSCSPDYDHLENGPPGRTNSPSKGKISDYHSADRRRKDHQKDRNRLVDLDYTEPYRGKKQERRMDHNQAREDLEPIVRWKEKPTRDYSEDPDRMRERNRDNDRTRARVDERTHHRARNTEQGDKNERLFDTRLGEREENRERHKLQERSRQVDHGRSRGWSEERLEWDDHKNRTSEVFEDHPLRGLTNSPRQRGRKVQGEFGVREAARDMAHLDLQDLERHDMEVARRLQDEEIKASQVDKRASQVAQDEELARRLMEEEKKEYKKIKEKEKQAMERRRAEVEYKPVQDNAVRPRIREEMHSRGDEFQRSRNDKPMRPPPPKQHYENINPGYAYPETPYAARPPPRPEAAYKGAYYRQ